MKHLYISNPPTEGSLYSEPAVQITKFLLIPHWHVLERYFALSASLEGFIHGEVILIPRRWVADDVIPLSIPVSQRREKCYQKARRFPHLHDLEIFH